eukprot:gnl/TRDRNA2_/TRDRNA2_200010_c0_seq1.p1 gnl/TRDRNA2_/TRDRNA2_200010_c0~~gnl/TRDRNA2_/TRDRNA2_200010_c0_seq1.p1  ORF type:complete len:247 (-),score=24.20 gnl/TRDRNA2_/TRDRNA2_200010_c0_seq1:12-752(-)
MASTGPDDDDCEEEEPTAKRSTTRSMWAILTSPCRSWPILAIIISLVLQNAPLLIQAGGIQFELCALVASTGLVFGVFPALSDDGSHVASLFLLICTSAYGLALAWYNIFQDDYYLSDCMDIEFMRKRECLRPRYTTYDAIYDYAIRETCMMGRIHDPSPIHVKERECYMFLWTQFPGQAKVAGQCLLAAVLIGGCAVLDSSSTSRASRLDENEIIAQAWGEECVQPGGPRLSVRDSHGYAALTDS